MHECSRAAVGQAGDDETNNLAIELFKGMAPDEAKNKNKSTYMRGLDGEYKCNN